MTRSGRALARGGKRNREFYGPKVKISDEIADEMAEIVFDPQTSGGLLVALPEKDALTLLSDLQRGGNIDAAIIGRVILRGDFAIEVA